MVLGNVHISKLGPPLYRFYLARFDRQTAEDLVQEVFTRLAGTSRFASESGSFEAFAWGIALNLQKETRRKKLKAPELGEDYESHQAAPEDDYRDLRLAVGRLEPPEIDVMQLVLADLSINEIGEYLGMPAGTVKSHIHRAKENLRTLLTKDSAR